MDDDQASIDDILEEERNHNAIRRVEPLSSDFGTPASPADDIHSARRLPQDHPSHDSNIDPSEMYEGEAGVLQ